MQLHERVKIVHWVVKGQIVANKIRLRICVQFSSAQKIAHKRCCCIKVHRKLEQTLVFPALFLTSWLSSFNTCSSFLVHWLIAAQLIHDCASPCWAGAASHSGSGNGSIFETHWLNALQGSSSFKLIEYWLNRKSRIPTRQIPQHLYQKFQLWFLYEGQRNDVSTRRIDVPERWLMRE